uniref:hypothetical protein n=1 Tax=Streptosporangium sp. CA-256172 TaxID=3240076 RepID=UPI003F496C5B
MAETEYYDAARLVSEVQELLRARGLNPDATGRAGKAQAGAGMLLRALGITPGMDMVDALARSVDKPWADRD